MKAEIRNIRSLFRKEINFMNKQRAKEFGKDEIKNFSRDYPPNSKVIFIKDNNSIVSFGLLRPIKIYYLNKTYNILGICSIISVIKGRGYGRKLMKVILDHLKKAQKTGLGFTGRAAFFKKVGLKIKKNLIRRFIYLSPDTKEKIIDKEGDGLYFEGKDKFITKILSTKSPVYINIPHW